MKNKKRKKIIVSSLINLLILTVFFVFPFEVEAARELCTSKILSEQKSKAHNINFDYELKYDEHNSYYYEVSFSNIKEGIEFYYGGMAYKYLEEKPTQILMPMFEGGTTLEMEVFVSYGYPCVGEKVGTKHLKLPKYNKYSELKECIEYEEFPLCGKHYEGDIPNLQYFTEKLEKYKASLNKEEPIEVVEKNKSIFEKIIAFYINNFIITLPITVIIFGSGVYYVIRIIVNNKRRIKIKF